MSRMRLAVILAAMSALSLTAGCSEEAPTKPPPGRPADAPRRGPTTRPAGTTKPEKPAKAENPVVVIETSMGTIKAELWINRAPITVKNFLRYVDERFYDNLVFHRVKKDFMIQGGGFDVMTRRKDVHGPIKNEATADRKNLRGTLAMARTGIVDSATSQFFINVVDNGALDHRNETAEGFGYCAFGKVIEGLDVVDKIRAVPVKFNSSPSPEKSEPIKPVFIKSIRRAK